MKKFMPFLFVHMIIILFLGCRNSPETLKVGVWRGVLVTESGAEVPFNFEVSDSLGKQTLSIINSSERFLVDEIHIEDDSIHIQMPLFDSELKGILRDDKIDGVWLKHLADKNVEMPFYAQADTKWRIKENAAQPAANVSGKWQTTFLSTDGKDTTLAIGEFVQVKSKVTGTFLTTTGDYRFLEGIIEDKTLFLSTFDGSHAYLFTATVENDSIMTDGKFYSGLTGVENFSAVKNENAVLPSAYSLTTVKDKSGKLNFSFPNLDGKLVSLKDNDFRDKVVILQILGSWCPNCMDETAYLTEFYKKYKNKGVEIVGLAYERTKDFEKSKKNVERLKKRFNVTYPLLITGYTNDKTDAAKSLPMLNKLIAFPTMIVLDKKGEIREIHTGFSGPGTGNHYQQFITEFETLINKLIAE